MWNEYFLASRDIPQRLTETDFTLVECFEPSQDPCGLRGRCQWQSVLRQALEAYFRVLDGVTLAWWRSSGLRRACGCAGGRGWGYLGEANPWQFWLVLEQQAALREEVDGQWPCRNDR